MNICAIVLAAGNGKRMGADIPKQFLKINGEYILTKTLRVFQESSVISDIVLVTGEEWIYFCHDEIVGKEGFSKVRHIITGGKERYFFSARIRIMFLYMTPQGRISRKRFL